MSGRSPSCGCPACSTFRRNLNLWRAAEPMRAALMAYQSYSEHTLACDKCHGSTNCSDGADLLDKAHRLRRGALAISEGR